MVGVRRLVGDREREREATVGDGSDEGLLDGGRWIGNKRCVSVCAC